MIQTILKTIVCGSQWANAPCVGLSLLSRTFTATPWSSNRTPPGASRLFSQEDQMETSKDLEEPAVSPQGESSSSQQDASPDPSETSYSEALEKAPTLALENPEETKTIPEEPKAPKK